MPLPPPDSKNMRKFLEELPLLRHSSTCMIESLCFDLERAASREPEVSCTHPPVMYKGVCLACGECTENWCGLRLDYLEPGLRAGHKVVGKLREEISGNLLGMRKLHLVLDLDNTLLHTVRWSHLTPDEINLAEGHLSGQPIDDLFINTIETCNKVTKLRPCAHLFLEEASNMFELSVYTKASRLYADVMVRLLDPERRYFGNRVITKEDSTGGAIKGIKSLDLVLAKESCTLILDDRAEVWPENSGNLLLVEPFNYFVNHRRTYRENCPSKNPKSEGNSRLADVLGVLKVIHMRYFDEYRHRKGVLVEVQMVVSLLRRGILKGCQIFTGRADLVTEMARQLGATIVWELSSSVTHVVSEIPCHAQWAFQRGRFALHPEWIFAAYRLWRRPPEDEFRVNAPEIPTDHGTKLELGILNIPSSRFPVD